MRSVIFAVSYRSISENTATERAAHQHVHSAALTERLEYLRRQNSLTDPSKRALTTSAVLLAAAHPICRVEPRRTAADNADAVRVHAVRYKGPPLLRRAAQHCVCTCRRKLEQTTNCQHAGARRYAASELRSAPASKAILLQLAVHASMVAIGIYCTQAFCDHVCQQR